MQAFRVSDIVYRVYTLAVFLMFLNSMYPWYMWNNNLSQMTLLLTATFSILLMIFNQDKINIKYKDAGLYMLIVIFILLLFLSSPGMSFAFIFVTWVTLLSLRDEYKMHILSFVTKGFAILLFVSLVFYVFFLFGISTTPTIIQYIDGRYVSFNYLFFIVRIDVVDFYRFQSIFMEPGHLTMGLVPLIMANRFDLRNKYVLLLFIVELFTFSLAGYITMLIGYLLFNFTFRRLKYILVGFLFLCVAVLIFDKTGNSEILDKFLWNRLEFSNRDISGNNRTTEEFNRVYEGVINSSYRWLGKNNVDIESFGGNSGYKKFIVTNGLIGLLAVLLLYGYNAIIYKRKDVVIFTFILLLLLFQNSYPLWFSVFFVYIAGSTNLIKYEKAICR